MPNKLFMSAAAGVLALGALAMPASAQPYGDAQGYYYEGCGGQTAVGTGLGAVLGGVVGNQFGSGRGRTAATVGGAILGGIAGHAIARDACRDNRADAYYYNTAYADAFDNDDFGSAHRWHNPYTGDYGTVTPIREYTDDNYGGSGPCREFQQTVYVNGHRAEAYGVACRDNDGDWHIIDR